MLPQKFKTYEAIILEWLRRILVPDFANKLTWLVALAGIGMVALPHALIVAVANWLIALVNGAHWFDSPFELLPYQDDPRGYWLIFGALIHNLLNKIVTLRLGTLQHEAAREKRLLDVRLFDEFVALLPSDGAAVALLKEHDFAGTIRSDGLPAIETFAHRFDNAEHEFLAPEIETAKQELLVLANNFLGKVAVYTVPKGQGFLTVYPGDVDPDIFVPAYLKEQISELNAAASALYDAHQAFIRQARQDF